MEPTITVASNARLRSPKTLTVLLRWPEHRVASYIDRYLRGAKTRQVGRFCAIQHPTFEAYGEKGLYDIAYTQKLPLAGVIRANPL